MRGGIEETSASFEARSAPRSYPTVRSGARHHDVRALDRCPQAARPGGRACGHPDGADPVRSGARSPGQVPPCLGSAADVHRLPGCRGRHQQRLRARPAPFGRAVQSDQWLSVDVGRRGRGRCPYRGGHGTAWPGTARLQHDPQDRRRLNRDTATRAWRSAGTPPPPGFIRTERPDTFAPSPQASVGPVPQPEIPVGNYHSIYPGLTGPQSS